MQVKQVDGDRMQAAANVRMSISIRLAVDGQHLSIETERPFQFLSPGVDNRHPAQAVRRLDSVIPVERALNRERARMRVK